MVPVIRGHIIEDMKLQTIVRKLAESGQVWVDWDQKALILLDEEGIYSFRLNGTGRGLLLKFKSAVEGLTGEELPSGLLGLKYVLSALITESIGSLPPAPK